LQLVTSRSAEPEAPGNEDLPGKTDKRSIRMRALFLNEHSTNPGASRN
jgi:hypothetical protein